MGKLQQTDPNGDSGHREEPWGLPASRAPNKWVGSAGDGGVEGERFGRYCFQNKVLILISLFCF